MDPTTQRLMEGAAGAAEATYVDDVFSTTLYTATGSSLPLTTGQDLDAEGGMVWLKSRSSGAYNHAVVDSARGVDGAGYYKSIYPNLNDPEYSPGSAANAVATSFNSNGLTLGNNANTNTASNTQVAWTFRKAPGFFDVIAWTGTGGNRNISHNLGSVPGCIILKRTDTSDSKEWTVFHRSLGVDPTLGYPNEFLKLNSSNLLFSDSGIMPSYPTSTEFSVSADFNASGGSATYVAYVFAHNDQSFGTNSDEAIINCGSFTVDSFNRILPVNLDFEPQFLILKMSSANSSWFMYDTMRGLPVINGAPLVNLAADWTGAEVTEPTANNTVSITATGFTKGAGFGPLNASSTGVYIAIRRPNKPATSASEVFNAVADAGSSSSRTITAGNLVDLQFSKSRNNTYIWYWLDRLRGALGVHSNNTDAESSGQVGSTTFDEMDGIAVASSDGWTNASPWGGPYIRYFLTRSPGFFDIVGYEGDGTSSRNVTHNLGSAPHLVIVKRRDSVGNWCVWSEDLTNNYIMLLSTIDAEIPVGTSYINSSTSTTFNIGSDTDVNASGGLYIAYLFDTLSGISKVGTYSGTGSDVDVDCGFSAGARFVLIKRIDSSGDWYTYDSTRGISSGNDPYLLINDNAVEDTGTDYIDPLNSGFTVTSTAPAAMNASGGTYLFLAIA